MSLNRVVAFLGPYISVVAGGIAAWLVARVNVGGIPGLDKANLATEIAAGLTFLLTAGLSWLGHSKWLKGHHIVLQGDAAVAVAAVASSGGPVELDPQHELEGLPSDEEEFSGTGGPDDPS